MLVIADGPRAGRDGEAARCEQVRRIATAVDWPCDVLTNFSDVNLGCDRRVVSGLNWAFGLVEEAIIFEDDCLPEPSFFRFCEEMLDRYRLDRRIGMICGSSLDSFGPPRNDDSYFYSRMVLIWGWATWRDRWQGAFDSTMNKWPKARDEGWLLDLLGDRDEARFWTRHFNAVASGKITNWDAQWVFANWQQSWLSIMPAVNLISNIGFGPAATHTTETSKFASAPTRPLAFPLTHPEFVIRNVVGDRQYFRTAYFRSLARRVWDRLKLYGRRLRRRAAKTPVWKSDENSHHHRQ